MLGDFPVVRWWRFHLPMQEAQVQHLVRGLRSHMPCSAVNKLKKKRKRWGCWTSLLSGNKMAGTTAWGWIILPHLSCSALLFHLPTESQPRCSKHGRRLRWKLNKTCPPSKERGRAFYTLQPGARVEIRTLLCASLDTLGEWLHQSLLLFLFLKECYGTHPMGS